MSRQIFKSPGPPIEVLMRLLEKISVFKTDKYYYLTSTSYKRCQFEKQHGEDLLVEILLDLEKYYIQSKKYFVQRDINYKRILTIVRQLCNFHGVVFSSDIKYEHSSYDICYKIYCTGTRN